MEQIMSGDNGMDDLRDECKGDEREDGEVDGGM